MRKKIKALYGTGFRSKDKGIHMGFYYPHPSLKEEDPKVLEEFYIEYKSRKDPKFDMTEEHVGSIKIYPRLIDRLVKYWKMNQSEVEGKGWADLKKMATHDFNSRILVWLERLVEYFKSEIKEKEGGKNGNKPNN